MSEAPKICEPDLGERAVDERGGGPRRIRRRAHGGGATVRASRSVNR